MWLLTSIPWHCPPALLKAMASCCAHLPSGSPWFEHVSTSKQSSCPQPQITTFAMGLSLGTAFTMVGQVTVLETGHLTSPKGISRHHCAQIGGFGPFYTVSHSICAPAELDFERSSSKAAVFYCREEKIAASSALPSGFLCIGINELLLLFIFLIKIKSLPLAQILPSD